MKKTFLKSALMAVAGVGLMAGSAMAVAVPYANEAWTDYEYYQADGLGAWMEENDTYFFEFDLLNVNTANPLTDSPLTLRNDVTGYGPTATPVKDVWSSVSIYSVDSEWDGFSLDIKAYYKDDTYTLGSWQDVNLNNNRGTFTVKFSNDLLADWIADPSGNLLVSVYAYGLLPDEYNDFNLLEVGVGVAPVPEPATMLLLGTGLAGLIGASRRRKAKKG